MDVINTLVNKLLDETDESFSQGLMDDNFFNRLDQDEIDVLEEILESVEFYIDLGGPLLILALPIAICFIRQRLNTNRMNLMQDQVR